MGNVIQVEFNSKDKEIDAAMAKVVQALRRVVELTAGPEASFTEKEATTLQASNYASKQYLEQTLQEIADGHDKQLLIDGVLYKQSHEPGTGQYHSLCGTLDVLRATYRRVGERNGPTVVPLELEAGLVANATPALCYSLILDYASGTSREYVESMEAAHRVVPSRSTVERIGRRVGASIERYLRRSEKVPAEATGISIGLDRTSVPYEEKREDGAPPKTRRKSRTKPYIRTPPDPVDVNYHMDYVGTISIVDADGEKLIGRKYAATHQEGPGGIVKRLMADVRAAKLQRPDLTVGIVQDGAPEIWTLLRDALNAEPSVEDYKEAIDRYHLTERLGEVLKVTEPDEGLRKKILERWEQKLDEDDSAIDSIYWYIELGAKQYEGNALETLEDTLTYIENNGDRMRYVTIREAGLPVGSGMTEGSCKSLVGARVKRSGQRWHDPGVSAVLTFRALHQSDRLPRFWGHLHRRYTASVEPVEMSAAA